MKTIILKVSGMSCGHCARRVQQVLGAVAGVTSAEVSLSSGTATIRGEPNLKADDLIQALGAETDYQASLEQETIA